MMAGAGGSGRGVQLGPGVEGDFVFRRGAAGAEFGLAKQAAPLLAFHGVQGTHQIVVSRQQEQGGVSSGSGSGPGSGPGAGEGELAAGDAFADSVELIPADLVQELQRESRDFDVARVHDPAAKEVLVVGKVKAVKGDAFAKVAAYVTGPTGSTLAVAVLAVGTSDHRATVGSTVSVSFPHELQQIAFCEMSETFGPVAAPFFLVRSALVVYVMRAAVDARGVLKLELVDELAFQEKLADVAFNSWDFTQFAAVDIRGVCEIWGIHHNTASPLRRESSTPIDAANPAELSGFKMVRWGAHLDTLLVIDRSVIQSINTKTRERSTLVVLNAYSSTRDFVRVSNGYAVLLTSRELSLLEVTDAGLSRLVSWKHFLDPDDPSLRLSVANLSRFNDGHPLFDCYIHSCFHSLVFNLQFWLQDGIYCCSESPNVAHIRQHDPLRTVALVPYLEADLGGFTDDHSRRGFRDENVSSTDARVYMLLCRMTVGLEFSVQTLATRQDVSPPTVAAPEVAPEVAATVAPSLRADFADSYDFVALLDAVNAASEDAQGESSQQSQADEVQRLASVLAGQLDTYMALDTAAVANLAVSGSTLSGITDLDELDSMVDQLLEHFRERGLVFRVTGLFAGQNSADRGLATSIHRCLAEQYAAQDEVLVAMAVQLALASITYRKGTDAGASADVEAVMAQFPDDIRAVLADWDSGDAEQLSQGVAQLTTGTQPSFTAPLVRVSQVPGRTTAAASQRPLAEYTEPQSSQEASQPSAAATQIERGSFGGRPALKKKKKKKLSGFA